MSTTSASVGGVFAQFAGDLERDADLRDEIKTAVKDVDKRSRELAMSLSRIHMNLDQTELENVQRESTSTFEGVRTSLQQLSAKIPSAQYYAFHELFKFVVQKLAASAVLLVFLQHDKLASHQETAEILGVQVERQKGFHLDLEDYLFGVLDLASQLSRYCVNRVTAGDYASPRKIYKFISQLGAGFRLLNLKNNELRRRFDSLKYDEKKVEEVIYDLSLRGLLPKEEGMQPIEPGLLSEIDEKTRLTSDFSADVAEMQH